ncbi:hypothetical protein L1887_36310 [Cichorium endivia]|nr:hypothetical protein L1887_36310 [Cichorium endivia]
MFDCSSCEGVQPPPIAIITSTTIKRFRGELTYNSTTATRIYLNPDIPEAKAITLRYKIHVRVSDESGSTTFVIFNQDAEKLIDSCANKFVNRLGVESNKFPEEIINLTGKTFVFKIKLTDYNLKDGYENYTVVKIFEVDDTLEAKFCGFSSDKGVESKGKRTATTMIDEQSVDFPNNVVASTETRVSICEGETSGDHVTPEKESGQMKKLKKRK